MKIHIENLTFHYKTLGARPDAVLDDINLSVGQGELLALIGSSGSGKTTLMQHLTGLLRPDRGRILIDGENIFAKNYSLTQLRRKIGLVFQFPESQLFEETVFADVAFGPKNLGLEEKEIEMRVRSSLASVGLDYETYRQRAPFRLSEGEKRRAAIAGVLALQPEFLALDEPTAGLDHAGSEAVVKILQALHAAGKTVLVISHNLDWLIAFIDRIVLLHRGRIHFDGHKQELLQKPEILTAAGLALPRLQHLVSVLKQQNRIERTGLYSIAEVKQELARMLQKQQMLNAK